jgi:hypothetical protein
MLITLANDRWLLVLGSQEEARQTCTARFAGEGFKGRNYKCFVTASA